MKRYLAIIATTLFVAQPALAGQCPADMAAIDAAIAAGPALSAEDLAKVTALRAEGESLHAAGSHAESVAALTSAKEMLGLM